MRENANPEIILGIPGLWPTRSDLLKAIITQTDGLIFAGMIILDPKTNEGYTLEVTPHDPAVHSAFVAAGRGRIPQEDLEAIAHHTLMLYLIGPGGTKKAAEKLMLIAAQLLKAGGIAVKVETAGVAHSAEQWRLFASDAPTWLCDAYTAYVRTQGGLFLLWHAQSGVA